MNNYCRNCGKEINGHNKCEYCGTKIFKNRLGELNKKLEEKYIKIFVIMFFLYSGLNNIVENTNSDTLHLFIYPFVYLLPLILIIFVIYAKKKLKYSVIFNIIYMLMIFFIAIIILLILFLLVACEYQF